MTLSDPFALERFVRAQEPDYARALAELRSGRKETHWMWYVFPQMRGLGASAMSRRYGISGLDEARAYLAHPLLGARLREVFAAMLAIDGVGAHEILGSPDDLKLRSSATLFAEVAGPGSVFEQVLVKYFGSERDDETLRLAGPPSG